MTLILWFVAYLVLVYVGLRLVVPFFGFRKAPLPVDIPAHLRETIARLDAEASDDLDFARRAHAYLSAKYTGSRIRTVTNFWRAFQDPTRITSGFLPCTCQNQLLRILLVRSGRFTDDDVELCAVPLNLFVHQYVRLNVAGKGIDIDPWSAFLGVPFGKKCAYIG